jgi:hypothetical protein
MTQIGLLYCPVRRSNYGFEVAGLIVRFAPSPANLPKIIGHQKNRLTPPGTMEGVQLDLRIRYHDSHFDGGLKLAGFVPCPEERRSLPPIV